MSNILAGFVKGFADTTRGGLERREEEERELRKAKILNDLRAATEKEMTLFKESTPAALEERDQRKRNLKINEDRFGLERERFEVGNEQWEREFGATQDYRNKQLSLSERSLNARSGKGGKDGENAPPTDVANELLYRYDKEIAELIGGDMGAPEGANNLSRIQIRNAAIAIADNTKDEVQAQREFAIWLDRQRRGMPRRKLKLDPTTK